MTQEHRKHHQQYKYKKIKLKPHPSSNSSAKELSLELLRKKFRLLPITIDHHGILGPQAAEFFLGSDNSTFTISPNDYDKANTPNETINVIRLSMHKKRHTNILSKANKLWRDTYGSIWYTNTYHAQTPRQWAKQVLGNTFSLHSTKHINILINQ